MTGESQLAGEHVLGYSGRSSDIWGWEWGWQRAGVEMQQDWPPVESG